MPIATRSRSAIAFPIPVKLVQDKNEKDYIYLYILYTYTVSRVTYTDEYRACIWTSLGEFRYERYESVYVTLLTV